MAKKLLDDCFAHDSDRLTHQQALDLLRLRIKPIAGQEILAMDAAAGRVLAQSATALSPIPAHTNSAVDGYAFAAADYNAAAGTAFPVSGRAAAGHPMQHSAAPNTAVRIFTGAVVPDGVDSVVMQEDVETGERDGETWVRIPGGLKPGANVRQAGEDVQAGTPLMDPGSIIRPQDLAGLASIGLAEVTCFKRLNVAIFSTGDEVIRLSVIRPKVASPAVASTILGSSATESSATAQAPKPLAPGQLYDANAPMLKALVATTGAVPHDLGVLPDDAAALEAALLQAASSYDVIITSGGASVGEEDHLVATLDKIGKCHMWQLAIKPGRPMTFGQLGETIVVGLPGNPVAVFVCFLLYVWPMLRVLSGTPWPAPRILRLPADFNVHKRKTGRREFWRAMLHQSDTGLVVEKFARDGSGLISSLRAADGLIDVPEDLPGVAKGDLVNFIPFSEYGILGR